MASKRLASRDPSRFIATLPRSEDVAGRRRDDRAFTWLNLVCLDAPLVAVAWQSLFAREFHVPLRFSARLVLFLTAWVIYLADRLADSFSVPPDAVLSARQKFCAAHRRWFILLFVLLSLANTVCVLLFIDRRTFFRGGIVSLFIVSYLAVNHFAVHLWRRIPVKEIAIGFFFALGVVAAVHGLDWQSVTAFGALCSLNCLSISVWERELDCAQKRISFATQFPAGTQLPRIACMLLAAVALVFALRAKPHSLWFCIASSSLLLALLTNFRPILRDERVALADLVLLTPFAALVATAFAR